MNKLGFAIKFASQGAGNAIECNKGRWTNNVVDIREYLKLFSGLQGTDNIVTFMSFDEGGCFLTQLRAISGRIGDFLSGWIYIPNTIEVSGEEVINTCNYVRNLLSQSNLNDYISEIESFFSKEYPRKEYVVPYAPSSGEEFGVRFNTDNMKEILGTDRYQSYYSKYKAIFLLDKDGEVRILKEQAVKFKNLTNFPIDKICILNAPLIENVRRLGNGVKIVFQNKQEFNSPVLRKKGENVQLYATRDGFETVPLPLILIQDDVQIITIDPQTVKWEKLITPSMFVINNRNHEKVEKGVRIYVNKTEVTYQGVRVSEEDCSQVKVKVTAPDYEPFEQTLNFLNGHCVFITLEKEVKSLQTTVVLANGSLASMTIKSQNLSSIHESPLKGYECDVDNFGKTVLRMSPWFAWKQRLWGFLGGLAVFALIELSLMICTWIGNGCPMPWNEKTITTETHADETTDQEIGSAIQKETSGFEVPVTSEAAIKYLDSSSVWTKSELEKYSDLQGLYEDLNNFDLSKLINYWYGKLSSSENFTKIYQSAYRANVKGWGPSSTYNEPGDDEITIDKYISRLNQYQTPQATNTGGGNPRSVVKKEARGKKQGNTDGDIFDE